MKLAIATIYTENIKNLAAITVELNKREYCEKHGYDLIVKTKDFSCKHLGFAKINFLLELLKTNKYDWILWCGSDTMITNYNIKLENLIDNNYHFIIANDVWAWNSDVFFIKNSQEAIAFFEKIYSKYGLYTDGNGNALDTGQRLPDGGNRNWGEQQAMLDLKEEYKDIIKEVPQKIMNAYLYDLYPSAWHQKGLDCNGNDGRWSFGDFLVHWPGLPNSAREKLAVHFLDLIIK